MEESKEMPSELKVKDAKNDNIDHLKYSFIVFEKGYFFIISFYPHISLIFKASS